VTVLSAPDAELATQPRILSGEAEPPAVDGLPVAPRGLAVVLIENTADR